jgi:hypothetical protein
MYALSITFADYKNNGFVELGGAAWNTRKEQLAEWDKIPAATGDTCFVLDKIGRNGFDIEDTKPILAGTAEALLGERIETLIERGRQREAAAQHLVSKRLAGKAARLP